jgi:3-hydroxyacyl-[acyl-carrier-protein] dehydratase
MTLDFEEIKKLIPQRFPFIMIDRIIDVIPGQEITAVKNVSGNDMFLFGHFPEKAVLPGALIMEAMAQTAIVLFAVDKEAERSGPAPIYYFGSVKARFYHPVVPGDQLKLKVVNVKSMPAGAYVSGQAFVDDKKVAEADLVFSAKNE